MKNLCKLRKKTKIKLVDVIAVMFFFFIILISLLGHSFLKQELTKEVIAFGIFGIFVLIFLFEFIPQFIGPHIPIIFGVSSGLNVHLVVVTAIIASIFGSLLGFHLGNKYGVRLMCALFKEKHLKKVLKFWHSYGNVFVFLSALIPLPYFPLVFGSLDMKKKDFIIYGLIVRIISFIIVGYAVYFGVESIKYLYF